MNPLRGRVAAVAVDNQDAFEPLLGHRIENVIHRQHAGFHPMVIVPGNARKYGGMR